MTTPLDTVQRWFQAVVSHPGGVAAGAADEAARRLIAPGAGGLEQVIRPSRNLSAEQRLSIYAHAYWARLLECMGACFPVLRTALGGEVFDGFAAEYLERCPSRSYTLDRLGERFPEFLDEVRPPGESWPDFLVDLARLELTVARVFDGPGMEDLEGQPALSHADLQGLDPERFAAARLRPVPCLHLLAFRYPVNAYYTAVRHAGEGEEVPVPEPGEELVAVSRRDFVVRRYTLSRPQHALLAALLAGAPVAEALAAAAAEPEMRDLQDEELASSVQAWFRFWAAEGLFQAVEGVG